MADDSNSRYRSSETFGHGAAQAGANNDPLAELARLIGQKTPADQGRPPPPLNAPQFAASRYQAEASAPYSQPAPPYHAHESQQYQAEPPGYVPPYGTDDRAQHHDWYRDPAAAAYRQDQQFTLPLHPEAPEPAAGYGADRYGQPEPHQYAEQTDAEHDYSERYAPQGYPFEAYPPQSYSPQTPAGQGYGSPGYPHPPAPEGYRNEALYEAGQPYAPSFYPREPGAGPMPPPHDDEFYDDASGSGRRRNLATVAAVLALAVIGTAGAFGYRSLFGGPSVPAVPPVIHASADPIKVAPPPQPDQSVNKFTYDRFSDAGKDEQLVRRDEKPVDLSKITPPPASLTAPAAPRQAGAVNPPSAIGDPRRVRTVPIRPNPNDVAAALPAVPTTAAPLPVTPPGPPQANALAPTDSAPAAESAQSSPRASASKVPPRPSRAAAAAPAANAPLSLSPDANNALPPPASAQPSSPRSAAPARVASAPASAGGSYLVQVSSQKSEADAENAYRGISQKYASVLGNQPHTVRRADLGSKGVYYRALVGPFASREEAVQLCTSLKQAGGDCVVQH